MMSEFNDPLTSGIIEAVIKVHQSRGLALSNPFIVTALNNAHYAQVRSYLRAANRKVGLLVNFSLEKADFRRIELP